MRTEGGSVLGTDTYAKQLLADQVLLEPARTGGSSGPLDTTLGFRVLEGNWSLYEDRPGKPGFITTGPVNSTIDFDVSFGAVPCVFAFVSVPCCTAIHRTAWRGVRWALGSVGVHPTPIHAGVMWQIRVLRVKSQRVCETRRHEIMACDISPASLIS